LKDKEKLVIDLNARIKQLESQGDGKNANGQTRSQLDALQTQVRDYQRELAQRESAQLYLNQQIEGLQDGMEQSERALASRDAQIATLSNQVQRMQSYLDQVQRDASDSQPVVTQLTSQISRMQAELDAAQREADEHQQLSLQLTAQMKELQLTLEQTQDEAHQQATLIQHLTEQLNGVLLEDESVLLENINGITPTDVTRLKAAGIGSVRDLAKSTPAQLQSALKPPPLRRPDYEKWIRYARILARAR
jgi:chromosome segregation ATPase